MTTIGVLLPLRLETRFTGTRLRLRVIPDEPWLDRHDPMPSAAELDALERYLTAAVDQPGQPAGRAAWDVFARQLGPGRAAWLVQAFPATRVDPDGTWHVTRPVMLREDARFTALSGLPERLEVWLARGGPPALAATHAVDPTRQRLDPPAPAAGARRWWESWTEAVNAGLATEIDLGTTANDIEALYVVGVGTAAPGPLFTSHRDAGQLGLLAYGAPTNTVDGAAAADLATDPAGWLVLHGRAASEVERSVSRALTGDPNTLGPLPGDPPPQADWARLLVSGLWPALWGHPLAEVFGLGAVAEQLESWATENLHPIGPYPAIRVGGQPYGLLPATALANWVPDAGDPPVEADMPAAYIALRRAFAQAAQAGGRTVEGADAEHLLALIGQAPASPGYATRLLDPLELWLTALHATGTPITWPDLVAAWDATYPLTATLGLVPQRRYGGRGTARRVRLPPVNPDGLPAGLTVGDLLRAIVQRAQQHPEQFVRLHDLVPELLRGGSLLLVLAARALQLAIAAVGQARLGLPPPSLEPVAADSATTTRLEDELRAATPADLAAPTPQGQAFQRVCGALNGISAVAADELERLLSPTIDCASHRIDAWIAGPAWRRLGSLLGKPTPDLRLGAYGWVDRPRPGQPGPTAGGLLHAPSAPQAVTAALLRDRADRDPEPGRWDMDITSAAARRAARLAAAVRFGAALEEALGREVERAVGDPATIAQLRQDFPIRTEHAGRRVCDGRQVLAADPAALGLGAAVNAELDRLREALDVYGDLLIADAVHHVVQGRPEAAGAAMEAAAGLAEPPALEVLRTWRAGRAVATACVVVIPDVAGPTLPADPAALALVSPAGLADAAAAALIRDRIGAAADWSWEVTPDGGAAAIVTLADLALSPAEALALPLGDLERLVTAAAPGELTGRDGSRRYDRAARLVALLGRAPATPFDVAQDSPASAQPAVSELRERYGQLRTVAAALAGQLAAATTAVQRDTALRAVRRWGVAPPPAPGATDPRPAQVARAEALVRERLAASPDATGLNQLELARAIADLASATGQVAVLGRLRRDALPALTAGPGLDAAWLRVAAAVRPPLARLEAAQLAAGTPLGTGPPLPAWTNRPTDPWQTDATDPRRLLVAYAPPGLDLAATPPDRRLAAGLLDRFAETIPATAHTTTAAFGFDAPGARAPQAILLAVPPDVTAPLDAATVLRIVAETRELAHARMATAADLVGIGGFAPLPLLPAAGNTATPI